MSVGRGRALIFVCISIGCLLQFNLFSQSIIHFQNWEGVTGDGDWMSETGDTNLWLRGTDEPGVSPGNQSGYISSDASTYAYDQTVAEETYLYKDLDFPSDASLDVEVTFDWKCMAEPGFDYMKVFIVDRSLATPTESNILAYGGFVHALNSGSEFSGQASFTTFNETLPTSVEGRTDLRIVFAWTNDNNTTLGDPAAIDNILITLGAPPASLSGDYHVGQASGADFPTLTDATYFLNTYGVSGDVTFKLTDATYDNSTESFPIIIDNFNLSPPSPASNSNSLVIKPNTGVNATITGSQSGLTLISGIYHGLITINEADNVTLDGSNDGSSSRNLTINNTSTDAANGIYVGSDDPAFNDNVTIKNCIIETGADAGVSFASGVFVGDNTYGAGTGGFSNLTIDNNQFLKGDYGIYIDGGSAGFINGSVNSVSNNDLDQSGADAIGERGIFIRGTDGGLISGNSIGNFDNAASEQDYGIYLSTGATNVTIEKNEIYNLSYTGTAGYSGNGIRISSATTGAGVTVQNNVIYGIDGDGWDITLANDYIFNPFAILLTGSQTGIDIHNNSISLSGNTLNQTNATSVGVGLGTGSTADIRNNIIVNNLGLLASNGLGSVGIFAQSNSSQFEALDYNNYFINATGNGSNYFGRIGTTNYTTLANWQVATGSDLSSISADPGYTSVSNLIPDITNPNAWHANGTGVQISTVTEDYNSVSRSVLVANGAPDMGAYEFTPVSTPNSATTTGSHVAGGTETFTVAGRVVAEIDWGASGTLPTINFVRYYSGANPPSPAPPSAQYFNSYLDIETTGGSGFDYTITMYYDEALMGTISAESDIRLAKRSGAEWTTYGSQMPDMANNNIPVSGLTSFSIFTGADADSPLPVELAWFNGEKLNEDILLTWETASEINNDYFLIERSEDARSWSAIGSVPGNGTISETMNYSYIDKRPLSGISYYRLKQIDTDGQYEYSDMLQMIIEAEALQITSLYPNPANDYLTVSIVSNEKEYVILEIVDLAGQVIESTEIHTDGGNNDFRLDVSNYQSGLYIVRINKNGVLEYSKFLKR